MSNNFEGVDERIKSEGCFGPGATPFLGYFILVEDAEASRRAVSARSPHFPADPAFQSASYQTRMRILCERMMEQQLYACASVLIAPQGRSGEHADLSDTTAFRAFLSRLAGHLAGEAGAHSDGSLLVEEDSPSSFYETRALFEEKWFSSIE